MRQLVPPYPLIYDGLGHGQIIPFLGSAASLSGREPDATWGTYLPTATELSKYLAQMISFPPDEVHELTKVAQYFHVVAGRRSLHQQLHRTFNHDYAFTSLHAFLAELPAPTLMVTTNYDDLIEQAFQAKNQAYDVVIHTTDPAYGDQILWYPHGKSEPIEVIPNKLDIDLQETTVIYKMHGAVDRLEAKRDQYVITEDDYIDFLTRMTKNKAIPAIFAEPFQTRHFLFLGYGLRDWNMRVVLNRIEKELRRPNDITSWAIQYKVSPLEQRFWQERGVEVYDMTIEAFVQALLSP